MFLAHVVLPTLLMTSFEVKCEDLQALILTKQSMDEVRHMIE